MRGRGGYTRRRECSVLVAGGLREQWWQVLGCLQLLLAKQKKKTNELL